tara:strand:+ start:2168 stop:3703 length:1536 start_codon:yes stop_codon:yes gene_type:complete
MKIIDNKALLLRVRDPQKIINLIPKSKDLGDNNVLVHWDADSTAVLRNLGIQAPAPITGKYAWQGKYKPFDHQIETAAFLTTNKRAFCLSEQGTGKTGAAIWASDYLLSTKQINRVLILCPLSIMHSAWKDDLFNFAMHRSVEVAYGSKKKRTDVLAMKTDYVIINYEGINIVQEEIAAGGFDLIIVDEATHYKNPKTNRWKALNSLLTPDTWLWQMTGTPAAQTPVDAFGLAKLNNPNSVPRYISSFKDKVMVKVSHFRWVPRPNAKDIVHEVLQPAVRFTKEECLDLPSIMYQTRDVEMTRQQKKYYKKLKDDLVIQAAGEEVTASNAAIAMNKLLQVSLGAIYTDNSNVLRFDVGSRYTVLKETIDESAKKVIVFVPYKNCIELVRELLTKDGITSEVISGDVPVGKRTEIFKRFQDTDDPRVLVVQPQAAAHGVTLTAANTIVWWGPTSSLEIYAQANARIHRAGQDTKCTIVQLRGSAVERRIYDMLDKRIDLHAELVNLYKDLLE